MVAALRRIDALSPLIDVIIEVRDARAPEATSLSGLRTPLAHKARIVLLNRADLAQPSATRAWLRALQAQGLAAFSGSGTQAASLAPLRAAIAAHPRRRTRLRAVVLGVPNVGKSSVINALSRRKRAVARDQPGVTRRLQWLPLHAGAELLDAPGVLAPRLSSRNRFWKLALCGLLPPTAYEAQEVADSFSAWCAEQRPDLVAKVDLDRIARQRGRMRRNGELDRAAAARDVLSAFRAGALGRVTLEVADG